MTTENNVQRKSAKEKEIVRACREEAYISTDRQPENKENKKIKECDLLGRLASSMLKRRNHRGPIHCLIMFTLPFFPTGSPSNKVPNCVQERQPLPTWEIPNRHVREATFFSLFLFVCANKYGLLGPL